MSQAATSMPGRFDSRRSRRDERGAGTIGFDETPLRQSGVERRLSSASRVVEVRHRVAGLSHRTRRAEEKEGDGVRSSDRRDFALSLKYEEGPRLWRDRRGLLSAVGFGRVCAVLGGGEGGERKNESSWRWSAGGRAPFPGLAWWWVGLGGGAVGLGGLCCGVGPAATRHDARACRPAVKVGPCGPRCARP